MTAGRVCYVCKTYVYGRPRHPACEPAYRRIRLFACERCGRLAKGRFHRRCEGFVPAGWNRCGYCAGPTRGRYHNGCEPDRYEYAVFADLPSIVQRRCVGCQEWYPFASIGLPEDAVTRDAWSPRGHASSGRPIFAGKCRACLAQERRERDRSRARAA